MAKKVNQKEVKESKELKHFNLAGSTIKGAELGQMFGHPVYKINKKAFVCFFHGDMVFKLDPESKEKTLKLKNSKLFDPSGKKRPMKEWVQLSYNHRKKWQELAEASADYIHSLQK